MPHPIDITIALLITVAYPAWAHLLEWPGMQRRLASGIPDPRVGIYHSWMLQLWVAVAVIVGAGIATHRPLSALALSVPTGGRLLVGLAFAVGVILFLGRQWRAVAKLDAATLARVRKQLVGVASISPHTPRERAWFHPLAVSAGICEELIFRGFLPWVFQPWLGVWGAAALSLASFTLAHSYQGRKHLPGVAMIALVFTAMTMLTGSVIPAMILHAIVDIAGGETAYPIFREPTAA